MNDEIRERIEEVARTAEKAFWKAVAAAFPTLTADNLDPAIATELSDKMQEAITVWVETNRPSTKQ